MSLLAAIPLATVLLAAGEVEPLAVTDPFAAAITVLQFSFEENEDQIADNLPDDWTRRRGPGFPGYVQCEIDPEHGTDGDQSLKVEVNGGRVAYYSPFNSQVGRVHPAFNYVFRGYIRTEHLKHDAALFSVSFLNARRQRIQRFVTRPVTGTHADWVKLELGPVVPDADARYVVLGCHVVHGEEQDIRGNVWFDGLWVGKLPRLTLVSSAAAHYLTPDMPVSIEAEVSGLEPDVNFQLFMSMTDVQGAMLARQDWPLLVTSEQAVDPSQLLRPVSWKLPPQQTGCYLVRAHLEREGRLMLLTETSVAVMESAPARAHGEFGWTLPQGPQQLSTEDLTFIATEAGINWMKIPLWRSMYDEGDRSPAELSDLLARLSDSSIQTVGLLNDPPVAVRRQFSQEWSGISEIFVLPREFWGPSLEPVLARYGSSVESWQIGGEEDFSFAGLDPLTDIVKRVKQDFDRIGRNSRIVVPWPWPSGFEPPSEVRDLTLTFNGPGGLTTEQLSEILDSETVRNDDHTVRWILLKSLPPDHPLNERAATLVRQMMAAKLLGARGVFLADVLDKQRGLVTPESAPTPLFLPWRTAAVELRGATHIGSFRLPGLAENYVFVRDGKATIVFPGFEPSETEANLGGQVTQVDMWGRRSPVPANGQLSRVSITDTPVFIVNASEPLARWLLEAGFEKGRLPSEYGGHPDAVIGRNTFSQGIRGTLTLKLPPDWEADPYQWDIELAAGESFRLPTTINLPQSASLGTAEAVLTFDVNSDRRYRFDVHRPLEVGLGDVFVDVYDRLLPGGDLEIEQIVYNNTTPIESLNFKCTLSVSGYKSQIQYVTRLNEGKDRRVYYIPDGQNLLGQEMWLNLEQTNGRRNLNKRLIIGRNPPPEQFKDEDSADDSASRLRRRTALIRGGMRL